MMEYHKYNITLGKEMCIYGVTGKVFEEEETKMTIQCLNAGSHTCYYWPVRVFEALP